MTRSGIGATALVIATLTASAALAQTSGGGASGGGTSSGGGVSTGGGISAPSAAGQVPTGSPSTEPALPSQVPASPALQRAVTGVNKNQQLRDQPLNQPNTVPSSELGNPNADVLGGRATIASDGGAADGTANRRLPRTSMTVTPVDDPGEISRPTAFELHSGRVPKELPEALGRAIRQGFIAPDDTRRGVTSRRAGPVNIWPDRPG